MTITITNRFRRAHLRSFLRLLTVLMLAVVAVAAPAQGKAQAPAKNPRFGIVNAYLAPDAAHSSGASWEIVTLHWDQIQPDGPTDWKTDPEIEQWLATARTQQREVVAVVVGTPQWATSGEAPTGVPRGLYLPVTDPGNAWAGFMSRAANYYGAKGINRWVIWKNQDVPISRQESLWDGSIEEYYQLVKTAYVSAKMANPSAVIHLGGEGQYDPNWFSRFIEIILDDPTAPANNYYFDVATLHVYDSPEKVYTLMQNHFFVMEQKGIPSREVWINETNARPAVDPDVYPADQTFREHPRTTMEQQASFIIQAYALAFAANRGARVATYQLADDLEGDQDEAFGLVRKDGDPRPAYIAYQLAAEQFSGFVFARRVDLESQLAEYVRLTFDSKVTHVAWATTDSTVTLVIPARTTQATLIDIGGNRWIVEPTGGEYRVVLGGALCNDPASGCLIGGAPWLLIEDGIADAVNAEPPEVTVEPGGDLPTPDPAAALTATAQARPTEPATLAATSTPEPTQPGAVFTAEVATQTPATDQPTEVAAVVQPDATLTQEPQTALSGREALEPRGINAILPYLLMALGLVAVSAGAWYFMAGHRQLEMLTGSEHLKRTEEHSRPVFPDDDLKVTQRNQRPEFGDEATREHDLPEFDDEVTGNEEEYFEEGSYDDEEPYDEDYDEPYEDGSDTES
jgi:hypothetical protein